MSAWGSVPKAKPQSISDIITQQAEDAGKDVDDGMSSLLSASRLSSSASLLKSDADEGADHDIESDA